jgi:hypothetical protein
MFVQMYKTRWGASGRLPDRLSLLGFAALPQLAREFVTKNLTVKPEPNRVLERLLYLSLVRNLSRRLHNRHNIS